MSQPQGGIVRISCLEKIKTAFRFRWFEHIRAFSSIRCQRMLANVKQTLLPKLAKLLPSRATIAHVVATYHTAHRNAREPRYVSRSQTVSPINTCRSLCFLMLLIYKKPITTIGAGLVNLCFPAEKTSICRSIDE